MKHQYHQQNRVSYSSAKARNCIEMASQEDRDCVPQLTRVPKRQRRITFHEQVAVRQIEHVLNFTDNEVAKSWYTKFEYQMMRFEMGTTLRRIINGKYTGDTQHYCARGLECRTPRSAHRLRQQRRDSVMSVLGEQVRQLQRRGFVDPEVLARVYNDSSKECMCEAARRGEMDAEESSRVLAGKESITTLICNAIAKRKGAYHKHRTLCAAEGNPSAHSSESMTI